MIIALFILALIIGTTIYYLEYEKIQANKNIIKCPKCGSTIIWTPLGTRSENFLWICLICGHTWIKTYPPDVYKKWKQNMIFIIRDAIIHYINKHHKNANIPQNINWNYKKHQHTNIIIHTFTYNNWKITIYQVPHSYNFKVKVTGKITWVGEFKNGRSIKEYMYISNQ